MRATELRAHGFEGLVQTDLPEPKPMRELAMELSRHDPPYEWTAADQEAFDAGQFQTTGQFLIDRDGIVRWANIECAKEGVAGVGKFPSEEEILRAARSLP